MKYKSFFSTDTNSQLNTERTHIKSSIQLSSVVQVKELHEIQQQVERANPTLTGTMTKGAEPDGNTANWFVNIRLSETGTVLPSSHP